MAGGPALNWAARATGAGFADHLASVRYKIKQDPNRTFPDAYSFLATEEVAPINEATIYSIVTFPYDQITGDELYQHYRVSKLRAVGGNVLKYRCLNLIHLPQTSAILMDRVDYDFQDWLKRTFDNYNADPRRADTTWAAYITLHLLGIISGVVSGLVSLFKAKHYHGNLLAGVAVKIVNNKPVGYIYNMRLLTNHQSPSKHRTRDINDLLSLIDRSVDFGYLDNVVKKNNDVDVLSKTPVFAFQSRVKNLLRPCISHTWILNDPHFWTIEDKSQYMKKLFRCLYTYKLHHPKYLNSVFPRDWHTTCLRGDDLLEAVYKYGTQQDARTYNHGASLVRFWRNAIEHFNERLFELYPNAAYLEDHDIVAHMEATYPIAAYCHRAIEEYFLVQPTPTDSCPPTPAIFKRFSSKMGFSFDLT